MHDLSGDWRGLYSYPAILEPMTFTARLRHTDERLDGATVEAAPIGTLTATLAGTATGSQVVFLKMYDRNTEEYDAVRYEGAVDAEGGEIWGTWTVPGAWSGTFLMIRATQTQAAIRARWAVRI